MKYTTDYGKMILPDGKYYSLDDRETRLNNNVMIVGTTGASKTRTVITPNLLECVGSYVVTDPKGNLYHKWGNYMARNGYRVLRLSFIHPEKSVHYNPLRYVRTSQQIQKLASSLVNAERSKHSSADPFWDEMTLMMINAILSYIHERYKPGDANYCIPYAMDLLRCASRKEERSAINRDERSDLEKMMDEHKCHCPDSWACKQMANVSTAPNKTYNTIVATSVAKFCAFDTEELAVMMRSDDIELSSIGKRKTALFVEVSDSDRSMDSLVNMFFTQAMNELCTYADEKCTDNRLPVPVRFIMDDFATNCHIDHFENMISNIRSRKISVMLALQSLSQLKAGYGESACTIADNCDTLIYMGGNDPLTAQSIATRCNKTTSTVLHMPLCTSWIFRRGQQPYTCRNLELDDYLAGRGITGCNNTKERRSRDVICCEL